MGGTGGGGWGGVVTVEGGGGGAGRWGWGEREFGGNKELQLTLRQTCHILLEKQIKTVKRAKPVGVDEETTDAPVSLGEDSEGRGCGGRGGGAAS